MCAPAVARPMAGLRAFALGIGLGLALLGTVADGAGAQAAGETTLRGAWVAVRAAPGYQQPAIGSYAGGQTVTLTGNAAYLDGFLWREVLTSDGATGWVRWEFLAGGSPDPGGATLVDPLAVTAPPAVRPAAPERAERSGQKTRR
ncbi:MAG: SH3 domain-containing protein, partial [Thermomicrobiales bacterium]